MKPGKLFTGLLAAALLGGLAWLLLVPAELETIPDISLLTVDGEALPLGELRGSPLLVTFWATTCRSCVRELPHLIELHNELSPGGLRIIGIAMDYDPPNQVLALRRARKIPYTIALDIHAEAAQAFGNVRLTPTSFLIAPDGRIVYRKTGELSMARLRQEIAVMLNQTGNGQPVITGG